MPRIESPWHESERALWRGTSPPHEMGVDPELKTFDEVQKEAREEREAPGKRWLCGFFHYGNR